MDEAQRALLAAKVEASSARNGLGLVKLMGRQSGFIAMQASMASGVVDVCLIPEITFSVEKLCQQVARVSGYGGRLWWGCGRGPRLEWRSKLLSDCEDCLYVSACLWLRYTVLPARPLVREGINDSWCT